MTHSVTGNFEISMTAGLSEAGGDIGRFDFTKSFHGGFEGTGVGLMLSCGDPNAGEAGYVAIETVIGRLDDLHGGFALQQFGVMHDGSNTIHYAIVPGSGGGELKGINGLFHLTIDADGTHQYELEYTLPAAPPS